MKPNIEQCLDPSGIYIGAQIIELTGIPERSFYRYVKQEKIPKHERTLDGRTVFLGHEVITALTTIKSKCPKVYFVKPQRGRPRTALG